MFPLHGRVNRVKRGASSLRWLIVPTLTVCVSIIVVAWYSRRISYKQRLFYEYLAASRAYALFVADRNGNLPTKFADLVEGGYLRAVADEHGIAYLAPIKREVDMTSAFESVLIRNIDKLDFVYGGNIGDYASCEAGVCAKADQREIRFVRSLCDDLGPASQQRTREMFAFSKRTQAGHH